MASAKNGDAAAPSPKVLYGIQIGRGLAALLVLLFHTSVELQGRGLMPQLPQGAAGVDVFFVISGFVIYLTGRRLPWREFLARRLARIIPLYWFFLTLKLLFIVASGYDPTGSARDPLFLLGSYLFIPVYRHSMNGIFPLIVAGWTLNYEMYFYLIAATVLALAPRPRFPLALTLYMLGAAAVSVLLRDDYGVPAFSPVVLLRPLCLEFVAGLWIAVAWTRGVVIPRWLAAALVLGGAIALVIVPVEWSWRDYRALAWGLPAAAVVLGLVNLEHVLPFRRWTAALLVGDASYSIYLSHTAVLPVLDHLVRHLPGGVVVQGLTLTCVCVLAGVLVYRWIERPLTRGGSRLLGLHVRTPQPQSATIA